jgi:hypothetical protein
MEPSKELKGAEVSFHLNEGKISIGVEHVGKDGGAKLEAYYEAKSFINKLVDSVEEKIPGDQKAIAAAFKAMIAGLEF